MTQLIPEVNLKNDENQNPLNNAIDPPQSVQRQNSVMPIHDQFVDVQVVPCCNELYCCRKPVNGSCCCCCDPLRCICIDNCYIPCCLVQCLCVRNKCGERIFISLFMLLFTVIMLPFYPFIGIGHGIYAGVSKTKCMLCCKYYEVLAVRDRTDKFKLDRFQLKKLQLENRIGQITQSQQSKTKTIKIAGQPTYNIQ